MKLSEVVASFELRTKSKFEAYSHDKKYVMYLNKVGFIHLDIYDIHDLEKVIDSSSNAGCFNGNVNLHFDWNEVEEYKERKYRLKISLPHLLRNTSGRYLNKASGKYFLADKVSESGYKTIFTQAEINAMDITGFVLEEVEE